MAAKKTVKAFPELKRSDRDADTGKMRLGDGYITGEFPALQGADQNADCGKMRVGDGYISGEF